MLTKEQARDLECATYLKDMKVGDKITEKHIEGINNFIGTLLDYVRTLKSTKMTFKPDENGEYQEVQNSPDEDKWKM